jgi:hypothetical protein
MFWGLKNIALEKFLGSNAAFNASYKCDAKSQLKVMRRMAGGHFSRFRLFR